jgi:hypothetical protein
MTHQNQDRKGDLQPEPLENDWQLLEEVTPFHRFGRGGPAESLSFEKLILGGHSPHIDAEHVRQESRGNGNGETSKENCKDSWFVSPGLLVVQAKGRYWSVHRYAPLSRLNSHKLTDKHDHLERHLPVVLNLEPVAQDTDGEVSQTLEEEQADKEDVP